MAFDTDDEFDYLDEGTKSIDTSSEDEAKPAIQPIKVRSYEEVEEEKQEAARKKAEPEEKSEPESVLFVVKVTTKKEEKAAEMIADKIKKKNIEVYSLAVPHGLRGYIFLEALDRQNAEEAVFNLPYVKGIIPKNVSHEEIKSMLQPVASEVNIEKNDIVEIISEPFKKEKAKVIRIDKTKEEAVVSLLGAIVPIPVTVKLDNLKVIRREDEEDFSDK